VHGAYTPVSCTQPSRQPIRPGAVITLGQATASVGDHGRQTAGTPPDFAQPTSLAGRVKQTRQRTLTNPLTIPPIQYLKYRPAENGVSVRGRWHALRTTAHDTCRVDQPHMNRWTDCKRVRYGEPATLCAAGTDMHLAAPLPYWATLNSCRQLLTLTVGWTM